MPAVWPILSQVCLWLALLAGLAFAIGRRAKHPRCRKCGYDMSSQASTPGPWTCPECGRRYDVRRKLFRRLRARWLRYASVTLFLAWYGFGVTPRVLNHGWRGAVPTVALILWYPWDNSKWNGVGFALNGSSKSFPEELRARDIEPPLDYIWAIRNRFIPLKRSPQATFYALSTRSLSSRLADLIPAWLQSSQTVRSRQNQQYSINSLCYFLEARPWGANKMREVQVVGDRIFLRTDDKETVALFTAIAKTRLAADTGNAADFIESSSQEQIAAYKKLATVQVTMPPGKATLRDLVRGVAEAAQMQTTHPGVYGSINDWGDTVIETPLPSPAPQFLDDMFTAALTHGAKTHSAVGSHQWSIIYGYLEPRLGHRIDDSYIAVVHDLSRVRVPADTLLVTPWDIVRNTFLLRIASRYPEDGGYLDEGAEVINGTAYERENRVFLFASPRTHFELEELIADLRAHPPDSIPHTPQLRPSP